MLVLIILSPYDFNSVDLVDPYVDLYKIGSGEKS